MPTVLLKVIWAIVAMIALVFLAKGLWANFYFEPTGEALAEARRGKVLVLAACAVLVCSALLAFAYLPAPTWVGLALLAPVVICGGLTLAMPESLFPQLGILVAYPIALGGLLGGLFANIGQPG